MSATSLRFEKNAHIILAESKQILSRLKTVQALQLTLSSTRSWLEGSAATRSTSIRDSAASRLTSNIIYGHSLISKSSAAYMVLKMKDLEAKIQSVGKAV